MRRILLLTITMIVGLESMSAASAETLVGSAINVIPPNQFCHSITSSLQHVAKQQGGSRRQTLNFANGASQGIEKQLKSGSFEEYYDVTALMKLSSIDVPQENRQWLSVPEILVAAMGRQVKHVLVVEQIDDLKMVPQVAPESQLLVLASSLGSLDARKARLVAEAAQFGKIQINIIWVGRQMPGDKGLATESLAFLAGATGGSFVDFSRANACPGV